jgi:hypothetical protein
MGFFILRQFAMLIRLLFTVCVGFIPFTSTSQCTRWQIETNYSIDVELNHDNHTIIGQQKLEIINRSPDDLGELYFHLYFNAFKPGSDMDTRSLTIADPDPRVGNRISKLAKDEQGWMEIQSTTVNGEAQRVELYGTIARIKLKEPIKAGSSVQVEIVYTAGIPIQIRRNGRMNQEGIHYSMAQWYPKLCHYDEEGWHPNAYIGREFYGYFGQFKVNILIDSAYTVAGTGYLTNAKSIGKGYAQKTEKNASKIKNKLLWSFEADRVHDFMWAADPNYTHLSDTTSDGIILRAFYVPHEKTSDHWPSLLPIMKEAFAYIQPTFGDYPYQTYSFIQGGDGGMEYPMATLITGHRGINSLVGVSIHELMHSWYQGVLGFNEARYYWMDEGFTSYASERVMQHLAKKNLITVEIKKPEDLFKSSYTGYVNLVTSGKEEPLSTHADHFLYNTAYGLGAYSKGAMYLHQLSGILGQEMLDQILREFYSHCAFKHPTDRDFIRLTEKMSGMQLKWYNDYWVYSTKFIDYSIQKVESTPDNKAVITIIRQGDMPMPFQINIVTIDDKTKKYYVPLNLVFGSKPRTNLVDHFELLPYWNWPAPIYTFTVDLAVGEIKEILIDPEHRMMDISRSDNLWRPDTGMD